MTTARDIITLALKGAGVLGVGQTGQAEDFNDALTIMNGMLAQWAERRWLVYHLVDTAFLGNGSDAYTVGPGQNFNIPRPSRIEAAFCRQIVNPSPNQVDTALHVFQSREDYNDVSLKKMQSFPFCVFYDSGFPTGTLHVWPAPTSLYEIHISTKDVLQNFANLSDVLAMPPEYFEALHYNLAARLRPMYQLPPDQSITLFAKMALNTIKNSNTQIPTLKMPGRLGTARCFSAGYLFGGGGGGGAPSGTISKRQIVAALADPTNPSGMNMLPTTQNAVDPLGGDAGSVEWIAGAPVTPGDPLYFLIQTAAGWTTNQMAAFQALALSKPA